MCAHGDLFHENVPDEWIDHVYAVMALSPRHTFQVLTKRPKRMHEYLSRHDVGLRWVKKAGEINKGKSYYNIVSPESAVKWSKKGLPNVWLGTSVEDQTTANERIPFLLDTPAAVRFISAEPLLGAVDLTELDPDSPGGWFTDSLKGIRQLDDGATTGAIFSYTNRLDWVIVGGESGPGWRPMDPKWARAVRDQCAKDNVSFFMKQMAGKAEIPDDLLVKEFPKI